MPLALATYNVKNLFDARDEDERARLERKLDAIAATLHACDADIVGLQEVGSVAVAHALAAKLEGYGEPIVATPDARGIRCALLSRLPLSFARIVTADSLSFPVFREGDPAPFGTRIPLRRGIVEVGAVAPGIGRVCVLVAHFKSSLAVPLRDDQGAEIVATTPGARSEGFVRSLVWRAAEALHLRGRVDVILASDPGAQVAVAGDLNGVPESAVLRTLRGEGEGALSDCAASIAAPARFSTIHAGQRLQIDHLLATAGLAERLSDARFLNADLRDHGAFVGGREEPMTVDSDHAPLVVRFG